MALTHTSSNAFGFNVQWTAVERPGNRAELGCLEAVLRCDAGAKVTNTGDLEGRKVDGQTVIMRKGSNDRISGMAVQLSTD